MLTEKEVEELHAWLKSNACAWSVVYAMVPFTGVVIANDTVSLIPDLSGGCVTASFLDANGYLIQLKHRISDVDKQMFKRLELSCASS